MGIPPHRRGMIFWWGNPFILSKARLAINLSRHANRVLLAHRIICLSTTWKTEARPGMFEFKLYSCKETDPVIRPRWCSYNPPMSAHLLPCTSAIPDGSSEIAASRNIHLLFKKQKQSLAAQMYAAEGYQIALMVTFERDKRYDQRHSCESSPSGIKAPSARGHSWRWREAIWLICRCLCIMKTWLVFENLSKSFHPSMSLVTSFSAGLRNSDRKYGCCGW